MQRIRVSVTVEYGGFGQFGVAGIVHIVIDEALPSREGRMEGGRCGPTNQACIRPLGYAIDPCRWTITSKPETNRTAMPYIPGPIYPIETLDGDERLLGASFEDGASAAGWVAIAVYADGALPVMPGALSAAGVGLESLPLAVCGEGFGSSPLDSCSGYIAVDPETRFGVVEVHGNDLGQTLRFFGVADVESPAEELRSAIREVIQEAASMAGESLDEDACSVDAPESVDPVR